jgi:Tol biopolymer transport system component
MNKVTKGIIFVFTVISITSLFVACGGGGGGDGGTNTPTTNLNGNLNPKLTGNLLFEYDDNAWLMDVSSGNYTKVPNTYWATHETIFDAANYFWLHMGTNLHKEFIVASLDDCNRDNAFKNEVCVGIQDLDGNYLANYRFLGDSQGPAKLSNDNQYFAIINEDGSAHEDSLQIYDRAGNLISSHVVSTQNFDWLDNNKIIYTEDRKFVITEELSTNPDRQLTLPSGLDGTIGDVEVSPQKDKFAFTLITSGTLVSTHSTPWVVNVDGTELRQLAVSTSDDPPPSISSPRWSPDGKWILLREGAYSGSSPYNPGSNGYAYVIPAENMGKRFVLSILDEERSPEVFFLNRYDRIESNPSGSVVNNHFSDNVSWIP